MKYIIIIILTSSQLKAQDKDSIFKLYGNKIHLEWLKYEKHNLKEIKTEEINFYSDLTKISSNKLLNVKFFQISLMFSSYFKYIIIIKGHELTMLESKNFLKDFPIIITTLENIEPKLEQDEIIFILKKFERIYYYNQSEFERRRAKMLFKSKDDTVNTYYFDLDGNKYIPNKAERWVSPAGAQCP
jgi:hypothetical protein